MREVSDRLCREGKAVGHRKVRLGTESIVMHDGRQKKASRRCRAWWLRTSTVPLPPATPKLLFEADA